MQDGVQRQDQQHPIFAKGFRGRGTNGDRVYSISGVPPLELEVNQPVCWTVHSLHELENLRKIWSSWPGSRDSDIDFFANLVRSRGDRCRPHVIVLARKAKPDVILIGFRERRRMPFTLSYFTICKPEVTVLEFVDGGLRGNASPENCAVLIQQVVRSLAQGEADLALWGQLDVHSCLYNCALRLPRFGLRDHFPRVEGCWQMNFPKGRDAFLASLSGSQRSKLRRKYRKLLYHFADRAQVRCLSSPVDVKPALRDIRAIADKTDRQRLFVWDAANIQRIHQQAVVAAERGWLRIYILYVKEKPTAFWMGTVFDHCLQADHVGFDPFWGDFSPGLFLFLHVLEDLRNEDIKTVDFGWGDIQFRQRFGTLQRVGACVHIYAPSRRGLGLNLLNTSVNYATQGTKFLVRQTSQERAWRIFRDWLARLRHDHYLDQSVSS